MRYSLRKLRRKLKRLEDRPMPGGKVNEVIQRYADTGELPQSERFLQRVAERSMLLAQIQAATCLPPHREPGVMHAVARQFTTPKDAKETACRRLIEGVAVRLSNNVDAAEIDRWVQSHVTGTVPADTLRKVKAVAMPVAFLIWKGVVRVASEHYICNEDADGASVAEF